MSETVIPACFFFLCLMFLWMLADSRTAWVPKCIAAALAVILSVQMWFSISSYRGYNIPVIEDQVRGKRAMVYWVRVEEPSGDDKGQIVLWMRMEDEISPAHWVLEKRENAPQVYSFPYDRDLHKATANFQSQIAFNDFMPIEVVFNALEEQKQQQRQGREAAGGDGVKVKWIPYVLPPAKLPPKIAGPG